MNGVDARVMSVSVSTKDALSLHKHILRSRPTRDRLAIHASNAESIVKILHFNAANRSLGEGKGEVFKVLVVDAFSLKIVATLLHTDALRQHGVTLVLAIDKEREAIADAPVVYFIRAQQDNAAAIVKDLEGGLYKEVSNL